MAKVILDMAMSLDGFISGPNGEDRGLHDYFFSPPGPTVEVLEDGFKTTGTIIMGRRAYEIGAAQQDGYTDDPFQVPLNRQKLSPVTEMSWWEAARILLSSI